MRSDIEELLKDADKLTDFDIWVMAVGMVAIAGKRAATTGNVPVNAACMAFVKLMATLVGTPPFPPKESAQ